MNTQKKTNSEKLEAAINTAKRKEKASLVLTAVSALGIIVMFFARIVPMIIVFVVLFILGILLMRMNGGATKKIISDNITVDVIKGALGEDTVYHSFEAINPGKMYFPFSYNKIYGSDHIIGKCLNRNIELGDIELVFSEEIEEPDSDGGTTTSIHNTTEFKGQWLIIDTKKELSGDIYISEYTNIDRKIMHNNVETGNNAFNNRFCIKADNKEEASAVLTPSMLAAIEKIADCCKSTIYLSIVKEGKMHLAIKTGRNLFEMGKGKTDITELRQNNMKDMKFYTDILEILEKADILS